MKVNKQKQVAELIKAGVHTRSEIKELIECTNATLASYLSGMRNAADYTGADIYPYEVEKEIDGEVKKVFVVMSSDEVEKLEAEKAAARPTVKSTKTLAEREELSEKRVARCTKAVEKTQERLDKDGDNRELILRHDKAVIELELAEIEQSHIADERANVGPDAPADNVNEAPDSEIIAENVVSEAPAEEELM